jgi:hypothetical protein
MPVINLAFFDLIMVHLDRDDSAPEMGLLDDGKRGSIPALVMGYLLSLQRPG